MLKVEKVRMHNVYPGFSSFCAAHNFSSLVSARKCQHSSAELEVLKSVSWRMKNLGCTMCILVFSSFSAEICEQKDEQARMHIVHPSLYSSAHWFQHFNFSTLIQVLTNKCWHQWAEGCAQRWRHPSFFTFSSLISALSVNWIPKFRHLNLGT